MRGLGFLIVAMMTSVPLPAPAQAQGVSSRDPAAFAKTLEGLGYKPGTIESASSTAPMFKAEIGGMTTAFVFGGCTGGRNCNYMLLLSSFSDLKAPPATWLNRINADFDLVKIWTNDEGIVSYSLPIALGADGIPVTTFRFALDQWQAATREIAQSAIKDGLVK